MRGRGGARGRGCAIPVPADKVVRGILGGELLEDGASITLGSSFALSPGFVDASLPAFLNGVVAALLACFCHVCGRFLYLARRELPSVVVATDEGRFHRDRARFICWSRCNPGEMDRRDCAKRGLCGDKPWCFRATSTRGSTRGSAPAHA